MITSHGYDTGRIRSAMKLACRVAKCVAALCGFFLILNIAHNQFGFHVFDHVPGEKTIGMSTQTSILIILAASIVCTRKIYKPSPLPLATIYFVFIYCIISFIPGVSEFVDVEIFKEEHFRSGANTRFSLFALALMGIFKNKKYQIIDKPLFATAMTLPTAALLGYTFHVDLHGAMSLQSAVAILFLGFSIMLKSMYKKRYRYLIMNDSASRRYRNSSLFALGIVATVFPFVSITIDKTSVDENTRLYIAIAIIIWFYQGILTWYAQNESNAAHKLIKQKLKMEKMAFTDKLTSVMNRTAFTEIVQPRDRRDKTGLILCDIDKFKSVNDTYGHDVGDVVLKAFAGVLKDTCRSSDWVVRWGGEEFLIIIENANLEETVHLAERLRAAVEELDTHPKITSSFGVTVINPVESYEVGVKRADVNLYYAKNFGRNQVVSDNLCNVKDKLWNKIEQLLPDAFPHYDEHQRATQLQAYKSGKTTEQNLFERIERLTVLANGNRRRKGLEPLK